MVLDQIPANSNQTNDDRMKDARPRPLLNINIEILKDQNHPFLLELKFKSGYPSK